MRAYINNYNLECCAGNSAELMSAIYSQTSAISINTSYVEGTPVGLGEMQYDEFFDILKDVVAKVLSESNLENFHNTLLILGSSVGGMRESEKAYFRDKNYKNIDPSKHAINVLADFLKDEFNFLDTRSISTACTSSANALLLAKRLINVNAYENILVVGADSLCYTTVCGFHALSVLSCEKCRPFDTKRDGMNVAEAVAALLVQNQKANDSIELLGAGASSDAYHMTNPDPHATGAIRAMSNALNDASLTPEDIDYINAHGTATLANDKVEALAIEKLFKDVHVNSTKAITGHTLGAAGALEAIVTCEVIKNSLIPAQTSLDEAENSALNFTKINVNKEVKYALSNSFAFGGNNTSILLGKR